MKSLDKPLLELVDDCKRFILRSFDGMEQSAMVIYHSALHWTPTSSPTRKLYEQDIRNDTKLMNASAVTWDTCTRMIPVGNSPKGVVFSPKGTLFAAWGDDWAKVFDSMTGMHLATFNASKYYVSSGGFSPDNGLLALGLSNGPINVWDVQTATLFRTFRGHIKSVSAVAFSPCGTMMAAGGIDQTCRIWYLSSESGLYKFISLHDSVVNDVCWLEAGKKVIFGLDDRTVRLWDAENQTCSEPFGKYVDRVTAVAYCQGSFLATSSNGTVNIRNSRYNDITPVIQSNGVTHSRFSIDGNKVLVAGRDSGDIWDSTGNTHLGHINYNGGCATFSPDGSSIISIYGKFLKVWATNEGQEYREVSTLLCCKGKANVYLSPDEGLVVVVSGNTVRILDATTGQLLFTHTSIVSVGYSPTSSLMCLLCAAPGSDSTPDSGSKPLPRLKILSAHTGHVEKALQVNKNVSLIALSPCGNRLVLLSPTDMQLLDLADETCLAYLKFDSQARQGWEVTQVSFALDGVTVYATGTLSNVVPQTRTWRISQRTLLLKAIHQLTNTVKMESSSVVPSPPNLPMVFGQASISEKQSHQDSHPLNESTDYHFDEEGEWILDRNQRHVLWIPPDERPRESWIHGRKVIVQTESGKIYIVDVCVS